jgi:hypothetical protein
MEAAKPFRSLADRTPIAGLSTLPVCYFPDAWTLFMTRHDFSSPVLIRLETAPGRKHHYSIKDPSKAMAAMRWYKLGPLKDICSVQPGIWLIATSALAQAQNYPAPETVEHARAMFETLARRAGILASA